MFAFKLAFL